MRFLAPDEDPREWECPGCEDDENAPHNDWCPNRPVEDVGESRHRACSCWRLRPDGSHGKGCDFHESGDPE